LRTWTRSGAREAARRSLGAELDASDLAAGLEEQEAAAGGVELSPVQQLWQGGAALAAAAAA